MPSMHLQYMYGNLSISIVDCFFVQRHLPFFDKNVHVFTSLNTSQSSPPSSVMISIGIEEGAGDEMGGNLDE